MKIPTQVRITSKVAYEVVYTEEFKDGDTLGECRPALKQIVICSDQSVTETLKTFLHEVLHAVDCEAGIGLTEKQVRKLEDALYRTLRLNKWL